MERNLNLINKIDHKYKKIKLFHLKIKNKQIILIEKKIYEYLKVSKELLNLKLIVTIYLKLKF